MLLDMSSPTPPEATAGEELATIGEAARFLGVSAQTLIRWERDGRIRAARTLGGHRRFDRDQLRELREQDRRLA